MSSPTTRAGRMPTSPIVRETPAEVGLFEQSDRLVPEWFFSPAGEGFESDRRILEKIFTVAHRQGTGSLPGDDSDDCLGPAKRKYAGSVGSRSGLS